MRRKVVYNGAVAVLWAIGRLDVLLSRPQRNPDYQPFEVVNELAASKSKGYREAFHDLVKYKCKGS